MWFSLVFKNLKLFIKNQPVLFVFIIITQIVCVITAFTVAGMIDAITQPDPEEPPEYTKAYMISFAEYPDDFDNDDNPYLYVVYDANTGELLSNDIISKKEATEEFEEKDSKYTAYLTNLPENYSSMPKVSDIRERIDKILDVSYKYLYYMTLEGYTDDTYTLSYTALYGSNKFMQMFSSEISEERSISVENNSTINTVFKNVKPGDHVTINSSDYIISKTEEKTLEGHISFRVSYPYCDNDFSVFSFYLLLEDDTPQKVRGEVTALIRECFSKDVDNIHEPEPTPLIEKQFNNMVYVVSFILIAVVLLNIARLYTYIMSKRQKNIAVCQLCGADKFKSFLLYITEVIITLIVTYAIGILLFHFLLINPVSYIFPTFAEFFNISIYTNIFIAYLIIGIVIMSFNLIPLVFKTVVENKK